MLFGLTKETLPTSDRKARGTGGKEFTRAQVMGKPCSVRAGHEGERARMDVRESRWVVGLRGGRFRALTPLS